MKIELNLLNKKQAYAAKNDAALKKIQTIKRKKAMLRSFHGDIAKVNSMLNLYEKYKR